MPDSLQAHGLYSPWNSPSQNTGLGSLSLLQGIFPIQGSNPVSHIAGRFFTSWATGKPKNTGVCSLSLLQQIFRIQELNRCLLYYRQILYQLSYKEAHVSLLGLSKKVLTKFRFVVLSLSCVQLFATPWTTPHQAPLFSTISWSLLKFMSTDSVMLSNHLILCHPLFLLHSVFPNIRVFPKELALHIRWPKVPINFFL